MHPKQLSIKDFTYNLPEERIASFPLEKRDASKLLFMDPERNISDHQFLNLPDLLPKRSMLVFNNTKVVQARLFFRKPTGGIIELFCLEPVAPHREVQLAMQQTGSSTWKCMVGNLKRWKEGPVHLTFGYNGKEATITAEKIEPCPDGYLIRFSWQPENLTFAEVLKLSGNLPIPPYLKRETTETDQQRYQTVYARQEGAVAAPTAGLHFTDQVFEDLKAKNISTAYLTLHVGAGTFKPVKAGQMQEHEMHAEQMVVEKGLLQQLLNQLPDPVIAVGTTSMRCLESLYWLGVLVIQQPDIATDNLHINQWMPYETETSITAQQALEALLRFMAEKNSEQLFASTQILIAPGYQFRICSGLVTNFHQPESTLLLLVAAIAGNYWRRIYEHALTNEYRFLSYGDSSLLLLPQ